MTHDEYLKKVEKAKNIAFFGGAGVSTESGIPDFRSVDGLYNAKYSVPPETILSADYFYEHTSEFYRFYFDRMIFKNAEPNAAHKKLAEWENAGKTVSVITQNIDGLHRKAGSRRVYEIHGTTLRNRCVRCDREYSLEDILKTAPNVPKCACGGIIKPDVVLYGEMLPEHTVASAVKAISEAELLIVGGTSLSVYPAAGLIGYFRGGADNIILINRTPINGFNNLFIGNIGELL